MSCRNFATVDALLVVICLFIFAGGVLAQGHADGNSARPSTATAGSVGDRR